MHDYAENKKARFDYEILEDFEGGLVLLGHEVKSVRNGGMKLAGSHVIVRSGMVELIGAQIAPYQKATGQLEDYDPQRTRAILLHKKEIQRLSGKTQEKGLTLVPLSVYAVGSKIKLKFAIARGKRQYEKRDVIRKRDMDREIRRSLKGER
jgi:SsrA-binding protein